MPNARNRARSLASYRISGCHECVSLVCQGKRRPPLHYADAIFVSTPDLLEDVPGAVLMPGPIDLQRWRPAPARSTPPSTADPLRIVHEQALVDGTVGHLHAALVHLNYRDLGEFIRKQERYCRLEAQRWVATFGQPRARAVVGQPVHEFWRRYVGLSGFREGWLGLVLCALLAWYAGKAVWLARQQTQPLAAQRPW